MVLEYTAVEPFPNQGWTQSNLEASGIEVTLLGIHDRMSTKNSPIKTEGLDYMILRKSLNSLSLYFHIHTPLVKG